MKYLVVVSLFLVLSYQNCGQNNEPFIISDENSSLTSCSVIPVNSTGIRDDIFYVGEVINFKVAANNSGVTGEMIIEKAGKQIHNQKVTTPGYSQKIFSKLSDAGDYYYYFRVLNGARQLCSTTKQLITITEQGAGVSCVLTSNAPSSNSILSNQTLAYTVTSQPSGLVATIFGENKNNSGQVTKSVQIPGAQTTTTINETFSLGDVGTSTRFAQVRDSAGSYTRCYPDLTLIVAAAPNPSPGISPLPSPSPQPSPSPTAPWGSISGAGNSGRTCLSLNGANCTATINWSTGSVAGAQIFYSENGSSTKIPISGNCSTSGSTQSIWSATSPAQSRTRTFYLYASPNCNLSSATLTGLNPLGSVTITWMYTNSICDIDPFAPGCFIDVGCSNICL